MAFMIGAIPGTSSASASNCAPANASISPFNSITTNCIYVYGYSGYVSDMKFRLEAHYPYGPVYGHIEVYYCLAYTPTRGMPCFTMWSYPNRWFQNNDPVWYDEPGVSLLFGNGDEIHSKFWENDAWTDYQWKAFPIYTTTVVIKCQPGQPCDTYACDPCGYTAIQRGLPPNESLV
jgi:hypothetical protein